MDRFESGFVGNPEDRYSRDEAQIILSNFYFYRLGHTWIPSNMEIFDRDLKRVERIPTEETFLQPDLTYRPADPPGLEGLAYWLSGNKNTATDR